MRKLLASGFWVASMLPAGLVMGAQRADGDAVAKMYPVVDPCGKCAQLSATGGPDHVITPSAGPCVFDGVDLSISADYIYWSMKIEDSAVAASSSNALGAQVPLSSQGKVIDMDFSMSSGFKVGMSMLFNHDGWDLSAQYTWFQPRGKACSAPGEEGFYGLYDGFFGFSPSSHVFVTGDIVNRPTMSNIFGTNHYDFNVVDLTMGRNFFISRYLKLRPFLGFKGSWQRQRLNLEADYAIASNLYQFFYKDNQDFWGLGIFGGINSGWMITRNFSIAGTLGVTPMWSSFKNHVERYSYLASAETYDTTVNLPNHTYGVTPVVQGDIGLTWEDWFRCEEFHYSISAAWEMQWWGNHNFLNSRRDLGTQGLTVAFRFDF